MKIIGICGSPRHGGNTEFMLKEALKATKEKGAKTELIFLADKDIKHCEGCTPKCEDLCKIEDDMKQIVLPRNRSSRVPPRDTRPGWRRGIEDGTCSREEDSVRSALRP